MNNLKENLKIERTNYYIFGDYNITYNAEYNGFKFGFTSDGYCHEVAKITDCGYEYLPSGARAECLPEFLNVYTGANVRAFLERQLI